MAASNPSLSVPTQVQLQIISQRNSALVTANRRLLHENLRLKAAMAKCKCDAKKDLGEPPAKRQRLETPSDPLELPEPCAMRILQFLPPQELLKATQVSRHWKSYIESRQKLMKRAMDRTVVNINFDRVTLNEVNSSARLQRQYKHMKITFNADLLRKTVSSWLLYPAIKRSSTLESLRISLKFDVFPEFFEQRFPNLVKLKLRSNGALFRKIPKYIFTALTTLKIESIDGAQAFTPSRRIKEFLSGFPKLQHLQIIGGGTEFLYDDVELWGTIPAPNVEDPKQPNLETIVLYSNKYYPKFLRSHQSSLTKLMVSDMSTRNLSFCLRDLKQLKCLTIRNLKHIEADQDVTFPQNDSIEILKISENELTLDRFNEALIAFPSLKDLAVKYCSEEFVDIRFLASNMVNLKWFRSDGILDERVEDPDEEEPEERPNIIEIYNEIKRNPAQYVNTTFELADDFNVDYDGFEELNM